MKQRKSAAQTETQRTLSATQALKASRTGLEVPAGKTLELSEKSPQYRQIQVGSVADLKRMSFLHPDIDEKRMAQSIRADDEDALQHARRTFRHDAGDCACSDHSQDAARVRPAEAFRSHYLRLRSAFHPALAQCLSEAHRIQVDWDSLIAVHSHRWWERLRIKPKFDIGSFVLQDIVVQKNATLQLAPSAKLLLANDIRIHVGGKIRTSGSYLKVRCASIQGNLA